MNNNKINELKRLNFEDFIWILFIVLSILDIVADNYQKRYIISNKKEFEQKANKLYTFVVFISFFIYLYFFYRNYKVYKKTSYYDKSKNILEIKLIGSIFFLIGVLCLIYFQLNNNENNDLFVGGPIL